MPVNLNMCQICRADTLSVGCIWLHALQLCPKLHIGCMPSICAQSWAFSFTGLCPLHLFPRWGHYEVIHLQAEIPTRHGMIGRTMAHARESKHSMQATHRAADRLAQLLPAASGTSRSCVAACAHEWRLRRGQGALLSCQQPPYEVASAAGRYAWAGSELAQAAGLF